MSRTKAILGVAVAVVVFAAIATSVRDRRTTNRDEGEGALAELRSRENEVAALTARASELQRQLVSAEERIRELEQASSSASPPEAESGRPGARGSGGGRGPAGDASRPVESAAEVLLAFPEYRRLAVENSRAGFPLTFGALYRSLNLSYDQIAAFEDLLVDQQQSYMDVVTLARQQGVPTNSPALQEMMKPYNEAASVRMVEILGAEGAEAYGRYQQTLQARASVDSLAAALYFTESPLTLELANALTEVISKRTLRPRMDGVAYVRPEIDWNGVIGDADALLSPAQLRTLEAVRNRAVATKNLGDFAAAYISGNVPTSAPAASP